MKINRPTETRAVVLFGDISAGDCFEFGNGLYVKTANATGDALLLAEADTRMVRFMPGDQCVLVNVEISYAYERPEGPNEEE